MKQQAPSYIRQLETELHRLGAEREQTRQVTAEVWAHVIRLPDDDPAEAFGPADQFARDVLAGRRPVRTRYLQQLSLELMRRGIPGSRVGEVLAEVDEHVTDTGEDPATAFGAPSEYAARIADTAGPAGLEQSQPSVRSLITDLLSVTGTLLAVEGIVALVHDHRAPLTLGALAAAVAIPLLRMGSGLLVRRIDLVGFIAVLVSLVGSLAFETAVLVWFRGPELGSLPAWAAAALGLTVAVASLRVFWPAVRSLLPEPVTDPRPGAHEVDPVWQRDDREKVTGVMVWGSVVFVILEVAFLTTVVLLLR
jgi:hypothetical protein